MTAESMTECVWRSENTKTLLHISKGLEKANREW